jgi:hypothetical protein
MGAAAIKGRNDMSKIAKKARCQKCNSKTDKATVIGRECGTWGREIRLCAECAANRK